MQKYFLKLQNFFEWMDDWVSELNSRLTFCYQVPVAEKCLELSPIIYVSIQFHYIFILYGILSVEYYCSI